MDRFTTHNGKIVGFEGDMDKLAEALLRLSEYENTGLLPEEIAELREEVAALRGKVERQKFDTYCLMIALKGENSVLKAKSEKAKEEIKRLQDKITAAVTLLRETRREDTSEPDPDAKLTPKKKQKIAWEAN